MIGTRTPFRISFVGGGSDLREFYSRTQGSVISTSIDKYMYIFIHQYFEKKIQVKYSRTELVNHADEIKHPIVREAIKRFGLNSVDINSIADVPSGTGLGSSSSYTVGLLHALYAFVNQYVSSEKLAQEACQLEIDILKEPIGRQDQYAAAYGGLSLITFYPNETVDVEPILLPQNTYNELEGNLLMVFTGRTRNASDILVDQKKNIVCNKEKFNTLVKMTELVKEMKKSLIESRLEDIGHILNEGWHLKKSISDKISGNVIDELYKTAMKNGALGGKLLGAGGGGFLLLYCEKEHQDKLRQALGNLRELDFRFESAGSKIIYVGDIQKENKW
jgi:D-glycero-alpha-D-manno-heptose-7-phosphate kinase